MIPPPSPETHTGRLLKLRAALSGRREHERGITSSAALDDDDLGFVEQRWTVIWTQISVKVLQGEVIICRHLALAVDTGNSSQFPMRHDHHHHAVRVFEFGVFREVEDGGFNRL